MMLVAVDKYFYLTRRIDFSHLTFLYLLLLRNNFFYLYFGIKKTNKAPSHSNST